MFTGVSARLGRYIWSKVVILADGAAALIIDALLRALKIALVTVFLAAGTVGGVAAVDTATQPPGVTTGVWGNAGEALRDMGTQVRQIREDLHRIRERADELAE